MFFWPKSELWEIKSQMTFLFFILVETKNRIAICKLVANCEEPPPPPHRILSILFFFSENC